jgi:hypothetical protein
MPQVTIKEFAHLPEEVRLVQRVACPYCGKELVGRMFCNPICSERYRRRCRRWDRKLAKERAEPQTATDQDLSDLGFEELRVFQKPEPHSVTYRGVEVGTITRRFG